MTKNYIKPWTRGAPYAMGGLLAFIFHRIRKPKMHPGLAIFLWAVAIPAGYFAFQAKGFEAISDKEWSRKQRFAFEIIFRPVWGICICWVIWACHFGYGGIINYFLSIKYFVTLSKIGYGIYMIHWCVLTFVGFVARYTREMSHITIV